MIPVFSIVGNRSNMGKTTVLCEVIRELRAKGYRVATIKHDVHGFEIDKPGKDTYLHREAGANMVCISSPKRMAIIEELKEEYTLNEMINKIDNVDIIITEGYKNEDKPKLEVFRKDIGGELYSRDEELFCIVSDVRFDKNIPQFNFGEIGYVADLIINRFLISDKYE